MGIIPGTSKETIDAVTSLSMEMKTLSDCFSSEYNRSFPYIYTASESIFKSSNHPHKSLLAIETNSILQGALTIYFFNIWDENQPDWSKYDNRSLDQYLSDKEKNQLRAYRHLRHCAAHKINNERARQCIADFNSFYKEHPKFSNITWDQESDIIDISHSSISADVCDFFKNLDCTSKGNFILNVTNEELKERTKGRK